MIAIGINPINPFLIRILFAGLRSTLSRKYHSIPAIKQNSSSRIDTINIISIPLYT